MADQQLVDLVREGRKAVAMWRRENPDVVLDLVDADLSETDLAGVNLRRSQMVGAKLVRSRLTGGSFAGADLTRADLTGAEVSRVNFVGARLFRATLKSLRGENSDFSRSVLQGADLSESVLSEANFCDADLREVDFARAEMLGVNFSHAALDRSNFQEVRCGWLTWNDVDLSRVTGLGSMTHLGPGSIGLDTLERSGGRIGAAFLRGNGVGQEWVEMHEGHAEPAAASDSFYIVYSASEESFAERLHNTLQKHGVRCWLDPRGDADDNGVTGQIAPRGFRVWDRVLLCATRSTLSSDWMSSLIDSVKRREDAARQEMGRAVTLMWPLNLDGFLFSGSWEHPDATEVAGRVLADFTGWRRNKTKFLKELQGLIEKLKEEAGGRAAKRGQRFEKKEKSGEEQ
ncbi:MAG TPA: hypothetical protein DCE43_11205 [Planctomycetaceae bacterium]|nr:hypothetical protein [Planctomycetaceae bacterium]|tara:strand:+ start:997 stop:2199 length:1203 start_codon:yes stop_codon:yes gene_type:complete